MGKNKTKIKRLAALWLSLAMLVGSVYTSSNYSSLADQTGLKILEGFKAENNKSSGSSDSSDGVTAVKATADNSDEITDGDVIDDTTSNFDAIDGDIATASNANAIKIARLTSSEDKIVIATSPNSYIKLFEDEDTVIKDPSDFTAGKYGSKTMKIDFRLDPTIDIPDGQKTNIGGEIIVPKGFKLDTSTLESDNNWKVEETTNEDGDTVLVYKSQRKLVFVRQTLLIEQDAQYLINNLDTKNEYKFALKLYSNYGEENQKLIVKNESDDETASFSFVLDDTEPTWTVDVQNNGITYKPSDFTSYSSSAADNVTNSFSDVNNSNLFKSGLVVRYHKTKGYMTDGTLFKILTEGLPRSISSGNQTYQFYIRYTDINDNVINLPISYSDRNDIYSATNGEYKLQAAELSNRSTTGFIKEFQVISGSSPSNSTYADVLYNEGTLEIKVMPNVLYNKLFYENDWNDNARLTFTSAYAPSVADRDGNVKATGDPITVNVENGTQIEAVTSAYSASDINGTKVLQYQYGTAYNYCDTSAQSIYIKNSSSNMTGWKVYDDFIYTIEYNGENGYGEALTPIMLTDLKTTYTYGLTYKIHIKNSANSSERIETILGKKNSSEAYPYTPSDSEKVIGTGLTSWNSNGNSLSSTEYVSKIEIVKDKASASYFRDSSARLGYVTLRARHYKIDGSSTNIPDGTNVQIKTTVKKGGTTYGPFVENVTTVETMDHMGDTLELATPSISISIQVNHATKDNGILGTYTLKKYPLSSRYSETDPPVIVLSGDGVTLTDRVSATNQKLLYIIGDDGEFYDVSSSGAVKASDYIINATRTLPVSAGYEHVPGLQKGITAIYAHRSSYTSYTDSKLYDLSSLYEKLGIKYATKLVISQDYINSWNVTNESGETWTKCFYANTLEPGHLNYDNIVGINSNPDKGDFNLEPVQLKYKVELYCKASAWLTEKDGGTYIDEDGGNHGAGTAEVQNLSKIVYGNAETVQSKNMDTFLTPTISTVGQVNGSYDTRLTDSGNILAQVSASGFTENQNNVYIDYDNVVYDFEGTDPQLLSITTGVGVILNSTYDRYTLKIEYKTSDGQTHTYTPDFYRTSSYVSYYFVPFEIDAGTYVTAVKVSAANEDYTWSKIGSSSMKMNCGLPTVTLCRAGTDEVVPAVYPSSGKKVGYQGNVHSSGRIYDQLEYKCTLSYDDIFGKHTTMTTNTGKSSYIARSSYSVGFTGIDSSRYTSSYTDKVAYDKNKLNRGASFTATVKPDIYLKAGQVVGASSALKLRPVFYIAIDKDFTPDTSNITGLNGASAVFYPAGTGNGYSGSDKYGYLVIDLENVAEGDLPSSTTSTYNSYYKHSKWSYGEYNIPLIVAYDANEGVAKVPIKHIWTDVPHDSGRDGSSGNYLARIDLESGESGAPDIIDSTGKHISKLKTNSSGEPIMLYRDLSSATYNQVVINTLDKGGMVPYVTENITGGTSQDSVNGRDFTELDKTKGLFGSKIYLVGNSSKILADFNIYIPVPKKGETNMVDGGEQSEASDFGLKYMSMDISELSKVATGVKVYYTTAANPGANGYTSMSASATEWLSDVPSDLSKITGIKVHLDELSKGARPYFTLQYQLDGDKIEIGELKAYQIYYCNYKTDSEWQYDGGYTNPNVAEYILEDMSISGLVWDESGTVPDSIYNKIIDSPLKGVTIKLYKKDGTEIVQTSSASNAKFVTAEDGTYELVAPSDGEFIVGLTKEVNDGEDWKLVNMLQGTETNNKSYGNPTTAATSNGVFSAKTDVLYFETNYAQGKYTLSNINFGLYRLAKISTSSDAFVHTGDAASTIKAEFDGYTKSLGDDYEVKYGTPADSSIIEFTDNKDNTASVKGLKAGKTNVAVSITDKYGNLVSGKINLVSYVNVKYDVMTNGGTGTVSDATIYYVDEYANVASNLKAAKNSAEVILPTGDPDIYTVKDGSGITPPTGFVFAGWSTNKDSDKDSCDRIIGQTYSITETDMGNDITLYAIYAGCDVTYRIEFYRQVKGQPVGVEASYEHYIGGDTIAGDTLATGSSASKVKAPEGYLTKFGKQYKFNADMSSKQLEQTIAGDGSTVVKLYYDIVESTDGGGGGSGGGGSSSTGKHAVNPVNADETNIDKDQTTLVEPKPDDNNYRNWVWGLMPKTGEEAAKMGMLLLSVAGLIAIFAAMVARRKQRK